MAASWVIDTNLLVDATLIHWNTTAKNRPPVSTTYLRSQGHLESLRRLLLTRRVLVPRLVLVETGFVLKRQLGSRGAGDDPRGPQVAEMTSKFLNEANASTLDGGWSGKQRAELGPVDSALVELVLHNHSKHETRTILSCDGPLGDYCRGQDVPFHYFDPTNVDA